jgi:hypothetical protein
LKKFGSLGIKSRQGRPVGAVPPKVIFRKGPDPFGIKSGKGRPTAVVF